MAISYKVVKRGKPGLPNIGEEIEALVAVSNETITPKDFLVRFSKTTRYSKAQIISFIYSLEAFIIDELKYGNIIQTGPLDTFYPQVKAKGWNSKSKKSDIQIDILYRPSTEMKKKIKEAELKKVE